jgi:hypothetical protein
MSISEVSTTPQAVNRLDETTAALCREIRALIKKGDLAGEEFYRTAGRRIKDLKRLHPDRWLAIVQQECGVSRSRAFELIAIGEGKKTLEDTRAETAARVRRHAGQRRNPLANGRTAGTVSAASDDAAIGTFIEGLGDRFFRVMQHAPAQLAETTKRILALHDRQATRPDLAPKATARAYGAAAPDHQGPTDFAWAMARAEFTEAKRKGTRSRSSRQPQQSKVRLDTGAFTKALALAASPPAKLH